jgi:hypothetical protein
VIIMIGLIGFFTDQFLAWFRGILFPYTRKPRAKPKRSNKQQELAKTGQTPTPRTTVKEKELTPT